MYIHKDVYFYITSSPITQAVGVGDIVKLTLLSVMAMPFLLKRAVNLLISA